MGTDGVKRAASILLAIPILVLVLPGCGSDAPDPAVQQLKLGGADAQTIRIAVQVPADHHGYLDAGDEGFLIPFAFTFPPLESRGARVVAVSAPPGKRDEKVRATVLRGTGEFEFRVETDALSGPESDEVYASLRYQICNDITNNCFPPKNLKVPLPVAAR